MNTYNTLVVRCKLSRFPVAKTVHSTGAQYVLSAIQEMKQRVDSMDKNSKTDP